MLTHDGHPLVTLGVGVGAQLLLLTAGVHLGLAEGLLHAPLRHHVFQGPGLL